MRIRHEKDKWGLFRRFITYESDLTGEEIDLTWIFWPVFAVVLSVILILVTH